MHHKMKLAAVALVALILSSGTASAQTLTTLLSFSGSNGSSPYGDLTLSGSSLYGMTMGGGANTGGNLFTIGTDGTNFQSLFSFTGNSGAYPGAYSRGSLTLGGSKLFGMAWAGGTYGDGNLFSVNTNGTSFQSLLSFSGTNGYLPNAALTLSGSSLYGMTTYGGTSGDGNIFSINTDGTGFQNLLSFTGTNGQQPYGSLLLSGSTLYGTTAYGGAHGDGTLFSVNTDGTHFQNLLSFTGTSGVSLGAYPTGNLTLSGSTLYGMTSGGGGSDKGTVFSLSSNGTNFQTLLMFDGIHGAQPQGSLVLSDATLYGMTDQGGAYGDGTIFTINTDGSAFQSVLSFDGTNGANPAGSLILSGSRLYGMTENGGINNDGTVFALSLNPTPEPGTFVLLAVGAIGFAGYEMRRRRAARRSGQSEAKDAPAILAFRSNTAHQANVARRAA